MIWGDPIYKLGSIYLEKVLHNMGSSNDQLKFGETGKKGIQPRYVIYTIQGEFRASYHGGSHMPDKENPDGYMQKNISQKFFSYAEILEAKETAEQLGI
ncbi:hypothetical protein [Acinetobacter sp. Ac_5812]|uniref:hypothetical protein n=1 Tax=Acinetobacter sp. Ac_5812 TaxID=1848937 RepID=UPI0014903AAE|nr:hypothetical protein [Acinetobacter sp. Ac_5812]NNP69345.1 hypothetical protein [Acinetobacter sp. Ac_5812]